MKVALKGADGNFYAGTYEDKSGCERPSLSQEVGPAILFEASVEDGKLVMVPNPPEGCWDLVPVTVTVRVF